MRANPRQSNRSTDDTRGFGKGEAGMNLSGMENSDRLPTSDSDSDVETRHVGWGAGGNERFQSWCVALIENHPIRMMRT